MIPYERRQRILEALERKEVMELDDLAEALYPVSKSTLRRDLKTLSDEGQVVLLRGGGVKLTQGSSDTPVKSRSIFCVKEKDIIAKRAAELVKDGEVIYLDAGTTTGRMIKYLKDKHITVVTSNTFILDDLSCSRFDCILLGGHVNKATSSVVGAITDNLLREMHFDKAFIGASGYDLVTGVNTPDYSEANKKRLVKANSRETYVLADSSKEGKITMCSVFDLAGITLITEKISVNMAEKVQHIIARDDNDTE